MKPYAAEASKGGNTGCCPGHDWPRLRRWSGKYNSAASKRKDSKCNKVAKRARRRRDKQALEK